MTAGDLDEFRKKAAVKRVDELVAKHPVTVFVKRPCPHCRKVLDLLFQLGVETSKLHEEDLTITTDWDVLSEYFQLLTGASTVPRVFVGGKSVGGCDDTFKLHEQGKLVPLLKEAGALPQ